MMHPKPTNPTHPVADGQRSRPLPRQHKPTPLPRILSVQEAASLLSQAPAWLQGPILMSLYAGLRATEIVGLQWTDIYVERTQFRVSAGLSTQSRVLPLFGPLTPLFQQLRPHAAAATIFLTGQGHPLTTRTISAAFYHASERAQLPGLRFHDLRQTCAVWAFEAELPLLLVAKMMGTRLPALIARFARYIGETHRLTSSLGHSQGPNKFHDLTTQMLANPSAVDPSLITLFSRAASTAESSD